MTDAAKDLPFDGTLSNGIHSRAVRVYFEDTDFSGVVYHASYLRFFERGRSDYLRCTGQNHADLAKTGAAFAVAKMEISFKRPARIDDVLTVTTRIAETSAVRLIFTQSIMREAVTVAEATVTVVLLGPLGRPQRLPSGILAKLQA